jgi:hypothetical protein
MTMRHLVILDIVPGRIEPADWADAYDEALRLLVTHPSRLLGYDWITVAGIPLPAYTRTVERDQAEPTARRWCVAGERATLATGEPVAMYRDLGRHVVPASTPALAGPSPALDDILIAATLDAPAESEPLGRALPAHPVPSPGCAPHVHESVSAPGGGIARVFGATSLASYTLPLLAAAMVVESRLPRWAMVHGNFDREQAEAARRWAEGVLGRPIALPVRVDAWRLVERLGPSLEGQALARAVERLYLAPPETKDATLLRIFGRADAETWWLGKLRQHARPEEPGALRLLGAYLEATRDLGRLCGLACLDARGPRHTPEALMAALALLRAQGSRGLDDASVEQALALVFGADGARLVEVLKRCEAASTPAAPASEARGEPLEGLATLPSAGDLTPLQREHVRALVAEALARAKPGCAVGGLHAMATSLALTGPTLTEDAWDWITREPEADLVDFMTALASLELDEIAAAVRRALFENRALCRYALGALHDDALTAALGARVQAAGEELAAGAVDPHAGVTRAGAVDPTQG